MSYLVPCPPVGEKYQAAASLGFRHYAHLSWLTCRGSWAVEVRSLCPYLPLEESLLKGIVAEFSLPQVALVYSVPLQTVQGGLV